MPNKFFIIILLTTLASNMPTLHSVCHVCIFSYWVDSMDQNEHGFSFSDTKVGMKSN